MSCMSTGELMYALVFAAECLRESVYLHYGVNQLTKSSLKRLFTQYNNSDYVTILCSDEYEINVYRKLMEGCYD